MYSQRYTSFNVSTIVHNFEMYTAYVMYTLYCVHIVNTTQCTVYRLSLYPTHTSCVFLFLQFWNGTWSTLHSVYYDRRPLHICDIIFPNIQSTGHIHWIFSNVLFLICRNQYSHDITWFTLHVRIYKISTTVST